MAVSAADIYVISSNVESGYYQQLPESARKRYAEKLDMIGFSCDPYAKHSSHQWSKASTKWPEIEYPDVYNYLVNTPSPYTKEEMKAYKSLEGYKYFVDGWVEKVLVQHGGSTADGDEVAVVISSVRHSQKLSATPVKPWIAALNNGKLVCAHCTCMAGLGEACSHIAALLFAMEANTRYRNSLSCTSELCAWLPPSIGTNVKYATASDMDFTTPDSKRVRQHSLMTTPSIDKASATSSSSTSTTDPASTSRKSSKKTLPQPGHQLMLSLKIFTRSCLNVENQPCCL